MPPAKGRRQERGIARRREIIDVAGEEFARAGYNGTSLADIAERVGITQPGILHHFGSKEALLVAVLEAFEAEHRALMLEIAAEGGIRALRRFPEFAAAVKDSPDLLRLFAVLAVENLHPDSIAHDYFVKRARQITDGVREIIEVGQARGEIRQDVDALAKATEIAAFQDGIVHRWLRDPDRVAFVEIYRGYIDALVRDIAASGVEVDLPVVDVSLLDARAARRSAR